MLIAACCLSTWLAPGVAAGGHLRSKAYKDDVKFDWASLLADPGSPADSSAIVDSAEVSLASKAAVKAMAKQRIQEAADKLADLLTLDGTQHANAGAILASVMDLGADANISVLAQVAIDLVSNQLIPAILLLNATSWQVIDNASTHITSCNAPYLAVYPLAVTSEVSLMRGTRQSPTQATLVDPNKKAITECFVAEAYARQKVQVCRNECVDKVTAIVQKCTNFTPVCLSASSGLPCTTNSGGEDYESYLVRMIGVVSAQIQTLNTSGTYCQNVTQYEQECTNNCSTGGNSTADCCMMRTQADTDLCTTTASKQQAWTVYNECYYLAVNNYNLVGAGEVAKVPHRITQMKAALQVICLLEGLAIDFADDAQFQAYVDKCFDQDYSTNANVSRLQILLPPAPAKLAAYTCPALLPGDAAYDAQEYPGLANMSTMCPIHACDNVCNHSAVDNTANSGQTTTRVCAQSNTSSGRIVYSFGTDSTWVNTVSAELTSGFTSLNTASSTNYKQLHAVVLEVWFVGSIDQLSDSGNLCGVITPSNPSVTCSNVGSQMILKQSLGGDGSFTICNLMINGVVQSLTPLDGNSTKLMY